MRRTVLLMALAGALAGCGGESSQSPSSGDTTPQNASTGLQARLNAVCDGAALSVGVRPASLHARFDRYVVTCQGGSIHLVDDK